MKLDKATVDKIKKDFPILKNVVYLDNAATTQKPKAVIKRITDYYEKENANIHRGVYKLSQNATKAYEDAHKTVANFINATQEEIIFTSGTTESLNLLAYSLQKNISKGDEILLTELEHHSNLVPWQQLAKRTGAILKFIPIKKDFTLDYKEAEKLITEKTKILSVVHVSNATGTVNDVEKLCSLAKKQDAITIIDGAQSAPHMKIDVKKLDCDFFAFSGHKLLGPTGIGVLFGKKELLEKMEPFNFGGDMIRSVTPEKATWNDLPWKFEAGTPNIVGGIALATAIEYLNKIGLDNIEAYEQELRAYALEKMKGLNLTLFIPKEGAGIISFNLNKVHAHDVASILDDDTVCIRGGHHCVMPLMTKLGIAGTSRASFYFYNTTEDIDTFVAGLHKAEDIFNGK
jgi:cysteine desulfurase/selenocysteine lyase